MTGRQGGLLASRNVGIARPASQREGPAPTLLEGVAASFRLSRDDQAGADIEAMTAAYGPLISALVESGQPIERYVMPRAAQPVNGDAVWRDIAAARARNPRAFAGLAADRAAFEADAVVQYRRRIADDSDTSARAGIVPSLVGGFAGAMTDPVNLGLTAITGGLGAGRTAAATVLREGVLNAGLEAVQQPLVAAQRARTGRSLTLDEAAINVAVGGAAGAALKGIELGARRAVPAIGDVGAAARERTIAGVWDRLPQAVRERWAAASEIGEADLPDLAELVVGRDNLSPDEQAAIQTIRREIYMDGDNPFVPNAAGTAMHRERIGEAVAAILADTPAAVPSRAGIVPPRRGLESGTAIGSGTVPIGGARDALKARIGRAESPGDTARNPRSSATGRYQFTQPTWLSYHKRVFGGSMSDAQRWAQVTDGRVQERLMDALLDDNSAFLRSQGEAESAGNLYLVHFAGQGGAKRVFDADPGTAVERLLTSDAVKANPFLRGMTAADLIRWAHDRMGGPAPARAGARVELAVDHAAGEASARERLQAEIDLIEARMRADDDAATSVDTRAAEGDDPAATFREDGQPDPDTVVPMDAAARGTVDNPVIVDAAADAVSIVAAKPVRQPKPVVRTRPSDIKEFLADRGGIRDDEGHNLRDLRGFGKTFIPRAGPLVRKSGMDLDRAAETLWEAGFFIDRPTTGELLDVLERAVNQGERIYALPDQDLMQARAIDADRRAAEDQALDEWADEVGMDPVRDREAFFDLMAVAHARGVTPVEALPGFVNERLARAMEAAYEEAGDARYDIDWEDQLRPFDESASGVDGPEGIASGPRGVDADIGAARPDDGASSALIEAQARAFDDPDGAAAAQQIESAEHDLRMSVEPVDPAIARRQSQEAALRAASPMRAKVDQDSTIGSPLFDAVDQTTLRFDDGDEGTLSDLFAELDDEAAAIDTVRACLPPAKGPTT